MQVLVMQRSKNCNSSWNSSSNLASWGFCCQLKLSHTWRQRLLLPRSRSSTRFRTPLALLHTSTLKYLRVRTLSPAQVLNNILVRLLLCQSTEYKIAFSMNCETRFWLTILNVSAWTFLSTFLIYWRGGSTYTDFHVVLRQIRYWRVAIFPFLCQISNSSW